MEYVELWDNWYMEFSDAVIITLFLMIGAAMLVNVIWKKRYDKKVSEFETRIKELTETEEVK